MTQIKFTGGMFGSDVGTGLNIPFADLDFAQSGTASMPSINLPILGDAVTVNANASINYDAEFGLRGKAHIDFGKLKSTVGFDSNAKVSTENSTPDEKAFVDTSNFKMDDLNLTATGPDPEKSFVDVDLLAKLKADLTGSVGVNYNILGLYSGSSSTSLDTNLIDLDIKQNLLHLTGADLGGLDGNLLSFDFDYGSIEAGFPEFTYDPATFVKDGSQFGSLHMSGRSTPFLTASLDLDAIATFFIPGFANTVEKGVDLGVIKFGAEAGIVDAKLTGSASIEQDFTYTPDVNVTMKSSFGQTLHGDLGDKFDFKTPEGEGNFKVTATYQLDVTIKAVTSLLLESSFDWKLGYGDVFVSVPLIDSWSQGFTLAEGSEPIGSISIKLFKDTSVYHAGKSTETFKVHYENFVTAASGVDLKLTTHQESLDAGKRDNNVTGNDLDNDIDGQRGDDKIHGNGGGDRLDGGLGDDDLIGGDGADRLNGGLGRDSLAGGGGGDRFIFDATALKGSDTIKDLNFRQGDVLDFTGIDANAGKPGDQSFIFIKDNAFSGAAGELRFVAGAGETTLLGDTDGNGIADFQLAIRGSVDFDQHQMLM